MCVFCDSLFYTPDKSGYQASTCPAKSEAKKPQKLAEKPPAKLVTDLAVRPKMAEKPPATPLAMLVTVYLEVYLQVYYAFSEAA